MTNSAAPAATPWKAPEPDELPEWRMQMCEHVVREESTFSLAQAINAGQTALFPTVPATGSSPGAIASVILARSEERRLREAQLYYATGDMTSLALAAASAPPAEPIKSTRLPSPYGFMVFAEPIGGYTHATESLMGALAHQGGRQNSPCLLSL